MGAAAAATQATSADFLDDIVSRARGRARARVAALKAKYPTELHSALAKRLVKSYARSAGVSGAATGALSLLSLPIGLPAGIALTLTIEAEMVLGLLEIYGFDTTGPAGRLKLYTLCAGGALADAAKNAGLSLGADAIGRALHGSLPAKVVARLNPVLLRMVLRRLGLGWVPKVLRFWPVLGAPVGAVIDATALSALGRQAIQLLESATVPAVNVVPLRPEVRNVG